MFGWLFKKKDKKMENDNKKQSIPDDLNKEILSKVKINRQFEIYVEELDEEGGPGHSPIWRAVKSDPNLGGCGANPVITVNSQADLQEKLAFYKQLGQRFKIIREINPPSPEMIRKAAIEQGLIQASVEQAAKEDKKFGAGDNPDNTSIQQRTQDEQRVAEIDCADHKPKITIKPKPKIITIGDMQIKYDGDKVYQKQWMKLTPAESANFRVVNDANNKIASMNGKHIEAKRWVLVEDTTNETDSTEDIINA